MFVIDRCSVSPQSRRYIRPDAKLVSGLEVEELNACFIRSDTANDAIHLYGAIAVRQAPHCGVFIGDFRGRTRNAGHSTFTDFADHAGRTSLLSIAASSESNRPAGKSSIVVQVISEVH